MKAAIAQLEITLATLVNDEPIHRREGNIEQADSCAREAEDLRRALEILRHVEEHPTPECSYIADSEARGQAEIRSPHASRVPLYQIKHPNGNRFFNIAAMDQVEALAAYRKVRNAKGLNRLSDSESIEIKSAGTLDYFPNLAVPHIEGKVY